MMQIHNLFFFLLEIPQLNQHLEAYDKQIMEKIEMIQWSPEQHQMKLNQMSDLHDNERPELIEKNELRGDKVANLECHKITLEKAVPLLYQLVA